MIRAAGRDASGGAAHVFVFGPLTALGTAFLETDWAGRRETILLARDRGDADILAGRHPGSRIVESGQQEWDIPEEVDSLVVVLCAFGMIHPAEVDWETDVARADRDVRALRRVLSAYPASPVHVVFVSTVVALSAKTDRTSYSGWKNVMFAAIDSTVRGRGSCSMSVVYPGRLTERKSLRAPMTLLSTTYDRLAGLLCRLSDDRRSGHSRIVGIDSRLWLILHALSLCRCALTARV